jgi:tetratricopeptide (TPR) repeat protein
LQGQVILYRDSEIPPMATKMRLLRWQKAFGDIYFTYGEFDDDFYENSMCELLKVVQICQEDPAQAQKPALLYMQSACLVSLGRINYALGIYGKAELYFGKDKEICEKLWDDDGLVLTCLNMSMCQNKRYRFDDSIRTLREQRKIIDRNSKGSADRTRLLTENKTRITAVENDKNTYQDIDTRVRSFFNSTTNLKHYLTNKTIFDT